VGEGILKIKITTTRRAMLTHYGQCSLSGSHQRSTQTRRQGHSVRCSMSRWQFVNNHCLVFIRPVRTLVNNSTERVEWY